jgi:hypothetical protein
MVTKVENLIDGGEDKGGVNLGQSQEEEGSGMFWSVWKGIKKVGSAIGRTIFWCNRADEDEVDNDVLSARVFSESNLAI